MFPTPKDEPSTVFTGSTAEETWKFCCRIAADASPAGPHTTHAVVSDKLDIPRLHRRLRAYGRAYGIPARQVRQMQDVLASPLAARLLQLPRDRLHDFLVLDAYKPKMHIMYDKYLNGVSADFALVVRHAPAAADPAALPTRHPTLWASFETSVGALSRTVPYTQFEAEALHAQFDTKLPPSLLDQVHQNGVPPVAWQQRHVAQGAGAAARRAEGRVAVASGPLVAASLVETPLMQRFQELAVAAQVEELRAAAVVTDRAAAFVTAASTASSPSECDGYGAKRPCSSTFMAPQLPAPRQVPPESPTQAPRPLPPPATGPLPRRDSGIDEQQHLPYLYDHTERLANSLVRLVQTVQRINELRHGCRVALFAGRRSSDLLYLVLQNLYCSIHLDGYDGTSSLYVVALLGREMGLMGVREPGERWGGAGRLLGTHAHEQVSALQQMLAPYDIEAGRRCGLPHAVALTPLLAHLLFLAANGGGGAGGAGATALPDTFTTAAFLAVARAASPPLSFRQDLEASYGWVIPEHARCFDLFRVWRLDSGSYPQVAEQVVAAWEERCAELQREGHPPLPRPQLMNSNLGSVEDIAAVCALDPRVRPTTLAFGTLADGFLPFLEPAEAEEGKDGEEAEGGQELGGGREERGNAAEREAGGGSTRALGATSLPDSTGGQTRVAVAAVPATATDRPHVRLASVVMKLVQARPPRPLPPLRRAATAEAAVAAMAVSGAPGVEDAAQTPLLPLPACAVKLGDGDSGKVQVDPRLEPEAAQTALRAAVDMARGSAASALDSAAVSAVLAEAYDAVTRQGVLMALPVAR